MILQMNLKHEIQIFSKLRDLTNQILIMEEENNQSTTTRLVI